MIVDVYIILSPNGDRPYVSTIPPSPARKEALDKQDCEVFKAEVLITGWKRTHDKTVQVMASVVGSEDGVSQRTE